MVTVYNICLSKGVTDQKKISRIGDVASTNYKNNLLQGRTRVESVEPAGSIMVWSYPDDFAYHIESIIRWVESRWDLPKPKKPKKKKAKAPPPVVSVEPRAKRPRIIKPRLDGD